MTALVNRDTDYAVRALCHLARQPEELAAVPEMCETLRVPRPFLRRILQALARAGMLKSCRGRSGGFRLAKPAGKITLIDVIGVFQGKVDFTRCMYHGKMCPDAKVCPMRKTLKAIEADAVERLKATTIGNLIEE